MKTVKFEHRRPWVAFYSHTGKEIKDLCNALDVYPDIICTNNPNDCGLHKYSRSGYVFTENKWSSSIYKKVFDEVKEVTGQDPLITLHGWMKIVPSDVCDTYEIYNGHPALINEYPELKGKDMQLSVVNKVDMYPYIGSVIHRCIPELDSGEIVETEKVDNLQVHDEQLIFNILRNTSLITWLRFLPKQLY